MKEGGVVEWWSGGAVKREVVVGEKSWVKALAKPHLLSEDI